MRKISRTAMPCTSNQKTESAHIIAGGWKEAIRHHQSRRDRGDLSWMYRHGEQHASIDLHHGEQHRDEQGHATLLEDTAGVRETKQTLRQVKEPMTLKGNKKEEMKSFLLFEEKWSRVYLFLLPWLKKYWSKVIPADTKKQSLATPSLRCGGHYLHLNYISFR